MVVWIGYNKNKFEIQPHHTRYSQIEDRIYVNLTDNEFATLTILDRIEPSIPEKFQYKFTEDDLDMMISLTVSEMYEYVHKQIEEILNYE